MARPKAADYERQRDEILGRATAAFAELGYPSASMSQLADACGTSKARLYHYFPSKEAMLFESLDRYTRRLAQLVTGIQARRLEPRAELAAMVHSLLSEYRRSRAWHVSLLNDVKFLAPAQRERVKAQERAVVEALAQTLDRVAPGRFTAGERKPATMALLGMINFTFAWLRPDGPMSHERYAELVLGLWERGLQPAATGEAAVTGETAAAPR
jgi:AcrR family transcriptional regulator